MGIGGEQTIGRSNCPTRSAHALADAMEQGDLSAREVTEAVLERIDRLDTRIRAYVTVLPDKAMELAAAIDDRRSRGEAVGRFAGIPIAIKDNLCTRGIRTTCSSKIIENFIPPYDASAVAKLKESGAVIVGKTNMDEFAMGSSTENSGFGATRNPWDLRCVPGGSSGGSAAAVAADMCIWATGSDTGGSIRQPASFCGTVGLKPSYGRVSRYGLVAFASSLDQIGPITKDVEDAAILLGLMAGADPHDSTCADSPVPNYREEMKKEIPGLRIGIPEEYFAGGLNAEVEGAVRRAVKVLADQGAKVVEISLPHTEYGIAAYYVLADAEAGSNLARYDGVVYGVRKPGENLVDMYMKTRSEGFGNEVKRRIMLGTYVLSAGYYDDYYLKAQRVRTLIRRDFDRAFQTCDVICTPTAPTPAFPLGSKTADPLEMYLGDVFTIPINLAGLPAISVPCGFSGNGLPIGLQIIGNVFDESTVLRAAYAFEQATDHHRRKPPLEEPA